jgi:hypothetical protein
MERDRSTVPYGHVSLGGVKTGMQNHWVEYGQNYNQTGEVQSMQVKNTNLLLVYLLQQQPS